MSIEVELSLKISKEIKEKLDSHYDVLPQYLAIRTPYVNRLSPPDILVRNTETDINYLIEIKGLSGDKELSPVIVNFVIELKKYYDLNRNKIVLVSIPEISENIKTILNQENIKFIDCYTGNNKLDQLVGIIVNE